MSQAPQEITVKGKATRIRGATWTHDQVKKLFQVWTQPDIYNGLLNEKKKLDIFKNMASILSSLGVNRTWRECRAKIKNLKADFRKAMDKKTPFRYYDEMKKIMNLDGSATRSGGGETSIDTYFSPIAASTPHSSQHSLPSDDQHEVILSDHENEDDHFTHHSPVTPERTTSILEPVRPSTSLSVIQSTPRKTTSPYRSPGHSLEPPRSYDPLSPSTSSKYPYSPISEHTPHRSPYQYRYYESQDEHREDWRQLDEQEDRMSRGHKDTSNEPVTDHDSSSRSSMIITHVISNVIEPVTQVVMPSSSGTADRLTTSEDIEIVKQPLIVDDQQQTTPPPIRLEFVLDDDNVILQTPQSPSHDADVTDSVAADETQPVIILPTSPPVPSTSKALPTPPQSQILRQRLKQQRMTKKASKSQSSHAGTSSSPPTPARPKPPVKRRKLFETLNKKTVETISDLLTETSQNLLQELQDAEQRFIVWEEEKRKEERKREEAMFAKLITAMKPAAASGHVPQQEENDPTVDTLASDFSSVSKRINDLVCGEVKQTEESVRQWELKMQRQESRHTEKLFAMIINAIKVSSSTTLLDG